MSKVNLDALVAIAGAVNNVAKDPAVPGIAPSASHAVTQAVVDQLEPILVNATNNEPWWTSRVTLGSLLAVAAGLLGIFGVAFPEEVQGQVVNVVIAAAPLIGGLFALYGRWKAKKPIGA